MFQKIRDYALMILGKAFKTIPDIVPIIPKLVSIWGIYEKVVM